ncbi:MAG: enoyl-CoA hydratase-related protein [Dehalococcoidia bacterium]
MSENGNQKPVDVRAVAGSQSTRPGRNLLVDRDSVNGVCTITLARPQRLNALSASLLGSLADAIENVSADSSVRAVVLAASGEAFCSGADTDEMAGGAGTGPHKAGEGGPEALRQGFHDAQRVILGLHHLEKPVIAAVNGAAVGAGFDLACACDIRLAGPKARFMAAYVRVGLFPGYGGTWFYPRLLGMAKAAELMFTGDFLEAEEAERIGFVNRVVPQDSLLDEARALAARIAAGPPIAIRLAKTMMNRGLQMDLDTAMQMAAAAESITLSSRDHLEGMAAMRERRKPEFKGI